jgi:hypothetical protein
MEEPGIPRKTVNLVKMTLRKSKNKVQIGGTLSDGSETTSGFKQSDSLSTLLINLTLEKTIHNTRVNSRGSIFNKTRWYTAYADDFVIIGRSMQVINDVIQEMGELTNDIGLKINAGKTKYMNTTKYKQKNMQPENKNINNEEYQEVLEFKYLGSLIMYDNDYGKDVQARTAGNRL